MEQTITLKQMKQQARKAFMADKGSDTTNIVLTCNNTGVVHVKPTEIAIRISKKVQWADLRQKQRRK